jgi:hypothetical protein
VRPREQLQPSPGEPGEDGAARLARHLGDLGGGPALGLQEQREPLGLVHLAQELEEQAHRVASHQPRLGRTGGRERGAVQADQSRLVAQRADGAADGDAGQPGRQPRFGTEAADLGEGQLERVVEHVLGERPAAQEALEEAEQVRPVDLVALAEGELVAGLEARHQRPLSGRATQEGDSLVAIGRGLHRHWTNDGPG